SPGGAEARLTQAVQLLGKLKRYSMEVAESRLGLVDIQREIDALGALTGLVEARSRGQENIEFKVSGQYCGPCAPPVLLLTMGDNMLRYGSLGAGSPGRMVLKLRPDEVIFQTQNRIDEPKRQLRKGTGRGTRNMRDRLDILFTGSYTFHAHEDAGQYYAE